MSLEFASYCFMILLCCLILGTVNFHGSEVFSNLFFAFNWGLTVICGVYFATNITNKWIKYCLSCLVGWVFSALSFEIVCIFNPELLKTIDQPSATFVWYLMAFMIAITIITIKTQKNGTETH
jgi:hypothetical protein